MKCSVTHGIYACTIHWDAVGKDHLLIKYQFVNKPRAQSHGSVIEISKIGWPLSVWGFPEGWPRAQNYEFKKLS